jgi:hypothetical protein
MSATIQLVQIQSTSNGIAYGVNTQLTHVVTPSTSVSVGVFNQGHVGSQGYNFNHATYGAWFTWKF